MTFTRTMERIPMASPQQRTLALRLLNMNPLRFTLLSAVWLAALSVAISAEPLTLKLWPEGAPGKPAPLSEATQKLLAADRPSSNRVTNVTNPEIAVYRPEKPNGASVIVAPGGGYRFLSYTHEGTLVCEWLNSIGVTAVLLKYRTPTRDDTPVYEKPVQDAQRALGIVRHHAADWGLDSRRVGLLGFSAGANLLGHVACDRGPRTYPQRPDLDDPRGPDFGVMIYGGGFLDKTDKTRFMDGFSVPPDAPPMFFLVAHDDKTNPVEAAMLYLEYKKLNLPAELHIYTKGGHGFGMRNDKHPINDWPARCGEWMKSMGFLDGK